MVAEHGHLSDLDLERYRRHAMPPPELLALDDHLAACSECNSRLGTASAAVDALDSIEDAFARAIDIATSHLTFDQMASLVDNEVTQADRSAFNDHLDGCAQCSAEVSDLLRDKSVIQASASSLGPSTLQAKTLARPGRPGALWHFSGFRLTIQAAAAAALVLLALWGATLHFRRQLEALQSRITGLEQANRELEKQAGSISGLEGQLAEARQQNETLHQALGGSPHSIVSLHDSGGVVAIDTEGRLTGLDYLNPAYQQEVKSALSSGRVRLPADVASLRSASGTLMGSPEGKLPYGLLQPVGTTVMSERPAFRWSVVPGATNYEVTIYGDGFKEIAASGPLPQTSWIPAVALQRGRIYTWQVVTVIDGKQVVFPPPAAPRARFKVLGRTALAEIERLDSTPAKSHLVLGVLYARHGLLDDSRRELQALAAANPGSELARKLLRSLAAARPSAGN